MKNVLLLIHEDEGQEARLQVALDATRALSGHLTCFDVTVPPAAVSDFYGGVTDAAVLSDAREREMRHLASVTARLEREDVAWSVAEGFGDPAAELRRAADLADLIVVSSRAGEYDTSDARRIAAEVAVKSGRPVLAVPPEAKGLDVAGSVLVAWDGSEEASAAVRAALPLLQLAGEVTLVLVTRKSDDFAADEAAAYLSRHGVHARVLDRVTSGPVSETVLECATLIGAAYIVLGAFGHGRALEALFGGVSDAMLDKSGVPLLLAH